MRSPARKLKKSAVKNIVRFPAIKSNNGKSILVESILESKYCLHLEFNPNVVEYFPQPKTFKIPIEDGETIYTPDFEVRYLSGIQNFVEVKPLRRSVSEHYQRIFNGFESIIDDPDSHFSVINEFEIYEQPLLSNYEKLYPYRKRPTLDMQNLHECASEVTETLTLAELIIAIHKLASLREIYTWLGLGYLQFNISKEPLSMSTEVTFNVF